MNQTELDKILELHKEWLMDEEGRARADLSEVDLRGASLFGTKGYYSFIIYDTTKRIVRCIRYEKTWMVQAGCFWGTLDELEAKVKETHNSKVYLANIALLRELLHVKEWK